MRLQAYVYLGWSPRLAVVPNGTNQVIQVVGWDGGSGTAPATGLYVGSTGYVTNITDGVNLKGAAGGGGGGGIAESFAGGNTFGNTFLASNGTVNWFAGSNISLSLDSLNQNATIIGNTPLVFSNSNGVSFGTNAGTVTATVATNYVNLSQSSLFQQTSLMSNYQPTGAYLTTAMQSNAGSNFVGLNSAITNGSMTLNSSGLSINLPNYLTTAMQSNAATISNINLSAGTQSSNLSAFTLANSNGVSFGLSNGVITGTVATNYQSQGAYLTTAMLSNASSVFAGTGTTFAGTNISASMTLNSNGLNLALSGGAGGGGGSINVSAGTTSNNLTAFTMSNANGVSFGLNGSVLTASVAAAGGAQTGISGMSAGTTFASSGTVSFANSNGVSFGMNGNTMTATVATNYQSQGAYLTTAMQSNAATISNINFSAGTTSGNLSALTFSNSNGISFGLNNGTVTATVATNYQSQGAYLTTAMVSNAGSNFIGLNTAITNGVMTANSSGISLNLSNLLTTAMVSNAGSNFIGLNTAITNGAMTANSSGISLNLSNLLTTAMLSNQSTNFAGLGTTFNGANISGSMTLNTAGLNLSLSAAAAGGGGSINISAGTTSNNLTAFTMSNANGVSFGLNGSVLTASVAAAGGAQTGISGISAGTTVLTSGTLSFGNGSGVTFGLNGSILTASVQTNYLTTAMASNAVTISNINLSAGTTSGNLSAFTLSNSNNVSFGLNAGTITASASFVAQTVQPMYYSASGTSSSSGTLQFGNTQGVSFSLSNGSIVGSVATNYQSQGAYLTTAMASNAGSNFAGLGSAISNGTMTYNSAGLSLNLSNHLTTAMLSNQSTNFAGLGTTFNGANISGSMTLNTAGLNLSLSAAAGGGGADGYNYINIGTTGTLGASFSTSAGAFYFNGMSGFSISQTSNTLNFIDNDIWYLAGNTAGGQSSSNYSNGLYLSGGANITLSQNGSSIAIIGAAGGGGGGVAIANSQTTYTSGTANFVGSGALTVGSTTGQSFYISAPALSSLSATGILSLSTNGNTISIGAAYVTINDYQPYQLANSTYTSLANTTPIWLGIYPQENVSMSVIEMISSLSFSSYSSTWNKGFTLSYGMYSQNGASTSLMGSSSMAMLISASSSATFGITLSQGTNSTTYATANSSYSALTGQKIVQMPFSTSLAAGGNYFFGMISSSSTAGSNVAATVSYLANNAMTNASFGYLLPNALSASAASYIHEPFGFGYTAGTGAFPSNFQASQMSGQSNLQPYVFFEN